MTLRTVPQDQEILDQFFSLSARPSLEKVAWLFGMVAVYGKTPEEPALSSGGGIQQSRNS